MLAAFLTAVLFALSSVFAVRATRLVGFVNANFVRLWLSAGFLTLWAYAYGGGFHGVGLPFFILSGIAGFGFGDLAYYASLPLIGARLASLMVQCLAAPLAALMEWAWLGTRLDALEMACGGMILAGVGVAISPGRARDAVPASLHHRRGLIFGLLAAVGQAGGAVFSRKAYAVAYLSGQHIDGGTAAFQRIVGGLLVVTLAFPILRRTVPAGTGAAASNWRAAWPWITGNCLVGAVFGVSCYQWALGTTPSAVVLPIVALTPLVVVPFAYFLDGERPVGRSLVGALLAVGAAAALARLR